jgi:ribosomal protein S18 acetylase RimI-like enzyme
MSPFNVRRLKTPDVEDYRAIRLTALQSEPEAFGSVYEAEQGRPMAEFAERLVTSIVFAAYHGEDIVAMVGLKQETGPKDRHKGFIWGMYVRPDARKQGIGTALMNAVLDCAREIVEQLTLTVVQGNDAALLLYKKFGFQVYGIEPRALKSAKGYTDELLLALIL